MLPTVGCVAGTAQRIAEAAGRRLAGRIDGAFAFTHPFGCSQLEAETASGRATRAALNGERGIAAWKTGVTV